MNRIMITAAVALAIATPAIAGDWNYDAGKDPMGYTYTAAYIHANEPIELRFPYAGAQIPILEITRHQKEGLLVYVGLEEGQILCDNYNHKTVTVRFDQGKPFEVRCADPRDHNAVGTYLTGEEKLLKHMAGAKTMTVMLEMYQNGAIYPMFDIAGIDMTKLTPKQEATKKTANQLNAGK